MSIKLFLYSFIKFARVDLNFRLIKNDIVNFFNELGIPLIMCCEIPVFEIVKEYRNSLIDIFNIN